jgi:beta-aspartyl-peptidase (threonine type)
MSDADRPPLVRLTWRAVLGFLFLDLLLTLALAVVVVRAFGAPGEASTPRAVLDAQAAAWNRGDLLGFMDGYWRSDDLTFFSGDQVTKGWQATLDRYRKKYQSEGREMGQLAFTDLTVDLTGNDWAVVRGRWRLALKNGQTPGGLFTLVMRRIDGQWRIIHDHTSAGDKP